MWMNEGRAISARIATLVEATTLFSRLKDIDNYNASDTSIYQKCFGHWRHRDHRAAVRSRLVEAARDLPRSPKTASPYNASVVRNAASTSLSRVKVRWRGRSLNSGRSQDYQS